MHIDLSLWPAILGATLGLPLIVLWGDRLLQHWRRWRPRTRTAAGLALAAFAVIYSANVYAWFIEPEMLVVRRVEIASPQWRGAPITIAALGDTHVGGPYVSAARIEGIVARVNGLHPDLVLLLGDYVAGHASEAQRSAAQRSQVLMGVAAFARLDAPYGAVAVLGNHDSWYGRQTITRALEEAGVAALWNRNVVIERSSGDVVIAGLADPDTGRPDLNGALDGAPAIDTIVISHSPDPFADAPAGAALWLAGRTHCGQVTIPLLGRLILPIRHRRYACHRVEEGGRIMYVTAGIGASIVPARFLNPPEIVVITVRSAAASAPT